MKSVVLFLLGAVLFSVILSKVAMRLLQKLEEKKLDELAEKQNEPKEFIQPRERIYPENFKRIEPKEFKKVLHKENSSESRKPIDYNDKQNLDPKFSPNVYRGKNGRFKSKKEWNKELKTS